jgi:hypothetical protein
MAPRRRETSSDGAKKFKGRSPGYSSPSAQVAMLAELDAAGLAIAV